MKTIYLMRHGQTLFNVMAVNQGQCDSPLTELGIQQAKNAGAWFQNHGITFDTVYCSTGQRRHPPTAKILLIPMEIFSSSMAGRVWRRSQSGFTEP